MLGQRVVTALVLMAVLLPVLAVPSPMPFLFVSAVAIGASGWEWARLNRMDSAVGQAAFGLGLGAACLVVALTSTGAVLPQSCWWLAVGLWTVGGGLALRAGPNGWARVPRMLAWPVGLVVLMVAWLALARARTMGVNFLLSTLCVVWMADIAAYFGGRAFGRRKLAPTISPGKSWAGVWSGMVGVIALAAAWLAFDARWPTDSASLFTELHRRVGALGMGAALVVMCSLSVLGDLFESMVKRAAGAKDSGRLLPGHGGVLDRIDALLPVLPAAMAVSGL